MSNGLTGEFDAVLELSGGTLNRLLATMHQAGADSGPNVPHASYLRLGEDRDVPDQSVARELIVVGARQAGPGGFRFNLA